MSPLPDATEPTQRPKIVLGLAIFGYALALFVGFLVHKSDPLLLLNDPLRAMPPFWFGFMGTATGLALLAFLVAAISAVVAVVRGSSWLSTKRAGAIGLLLLLPALLGQVLDWTRS